ncbi:winged helix-turn-helix domain-containing protein [Micromonospora sp. Llam7]|uniref:winged helix-turn-helix domain-containing protein n=1 Tax=Micromonospora tarapacensis TaxID=2835305 RepID=UPI001C831EE9|nr:transcriptional regulator [Micromonospora tarapacensis]MBX7267421.1 winged helix-turn-helix domain-containing protein [Micromonospora tarapacensis]
MADEVYRFGSFDLDVTRRQLSCADRPIHVEPRALALLCHLVENRDRLVTKAELLDTVWRGRFVSEAALTTALRTARRSIGDDGTRQRLIRTLQRRGYQFVAPTTLRPATAPAGPDAAVPAPARRPGPGGAARTARSSVSAGPGTAPASPMPSPVTALP